jgi:hypothetical protein
MFLITTVTKWVTQRDGKARISTPEVATGRIFVLNTNRMVDIRVNGAGSKFYFFDNHLDRREGKSYIECNSSVMSIIIAKNTEIEAGFQILPVYKYNNISKSTTDVYFMLKDIAYIDAYKPSPTHASWVVYLQNGFKRVECLVAMPYNQIYNLFYGLPTGGFVYYSYYDDGVAIWRKGCRNGYFMLDHALTPLGFGGFETADWENVKQRS